MNELDQKLAEAKAALSRAGGVYLADPMACEPFAELEQALDGLIAAIDASGVIQDAKRWRWSIADYAKHGVNAERYTRVIDATMEMYPKDGV